VNSGVSLSASQRPLRPERLDALTGLRLIAAFCILFAHANEWLTPFSDYNPFHNGNMVSIYGMPLFFVLSGFVIHYNYGKLFATMRFRWAAAQFLGARVARLYPLLLACLAVGLIVDGTFQWIHPHPTWWLELVGGFLTMTQSWFYIIIFDDHRLLMENAFGLGWSISTEFFFYLAYLGLVFLFMRLRTPRATGIAWIIFGSAAFLFFVECNIHLVGISAFAQQYVPNYVSETENHASSFTRWLFYYSPYTRIFEFVLGCLTAQFYLQTAGRPIGDREQRWAKGALWSALAALVVIGFFYLSSNPSPRLHNLVLFLHNNFLCAIPIATVIFCAARYETRFSDFLCHRRMVLLGEMSYSIYAVHTWTLRIFEHEPTKFGLTAGADAVARIALGIAVTLVLSTATYRLIEIPGRAKLRGFFAAAMVRAMGDAPANTRGKPGSSAGEDDGDRAAARPAVEGGTNAS
jgi:peptidoglycan/LPS O-acetylase OafA/YrhL